MGEVDRIHRIVQPPSVPAPANQVIRPEEHREERKEPQEDKLELHEEPEGESNIVEDQPNDDPPALDIAV